MQKVKVLLLAVMVVLLAGCATSRSMIDIPASAPQTAQTPVPSNGRTVYIHAVRDKRSFQESPPSPDIPSLDPSEASSDDIRRRAVGRKRNTWGKALGDILLKEGTTIESLTSSAIQRAFSEKGYMVLDASDQVTPDTYVVDADITQFWTWMNPGFWALTISSEISTDLTIKEASSTQKSTVEVKSADHFQTGMESNYIQVITNALNLYVEELKRKLK